MTAAPRPWVCGGAPHDLGDGMDGIGRALGLVLVAFVVAAAAWPLRWLGPRPRAAALLPLLAIGAALPIAAPETSLWTRALPALFCLVIALKLVDLHVGAADWRTRTAREWLGFLAGHFVLVYRAYIRQPRRPAPHSAALLARGLAEVAAGAAILWWAFGHDFGSFWVEHTVKAVGIYLAVLDGLFVLLTGAARLSGFRVADQSRHPILASTPADFWRRYNMEAGRFLYEDVFKPLGGRRAPAIMIMAAFLINGLIHEYLWWLMSDVVTGYQVLLFAIFGAATVATWRWRPTGLLRVAGVLLTIVFNLVVSVLFFASAETFIDWYSAPPPLPVPGVIEK